MVARRPAFAGSWYPEDEKACREQIETFLTDDPPGEKPHAARAGVVPHAGWFFSGAIACRVIQALHEKSTAPDAVVLFGMHMHPAQRPIIMDRGAWETPLGILPVAEELARYLTEHITFVIEKPQDPNRDNTIELQLPFIRHFFGEVPILPIGVPPTPIALDIANTLMEGARSLGLDLKAVGSTDLTHYGPNYGFTTHGTGRAAVAWVKETNDRRFIDAALKLRPEDVITGARNYRNACCAGAAAAAIQTALGLGATQGTLLAYTTSYDKIPGDSFVGYAGITYC